MKLSFGDDALEVSSNHVQVTKNDGSLTNQEAVNQLVVDEMLQLRARIEWLEGKHGIIKLPDGYIMADLHIFEANGVANAYLPIPNDTAPTFVAINGEEVDPIQGPYQLMDGDLLYAIFDWDNGNFKQLKWIKDIQQFGLNTRTGKRNQLADGEYAFRYMNAASPEALKYLDTSNLESTKQMFFHADVMNVDLGDWDVSNVMDFYQMFNYAAAFNQDVSSWVTKNVEYRGMNGMFKNATAFNQDLTQWCVPGEWEAPLDFATSSGLAAGNYPVWGTCPRYENIAPFSEADMHIIEANAADTFILPCRGNSNVLYFEVNGVQIDLTRRMRKTSVRVADHPVFEEHQNNPKVVTREVEIDMEGPDGQPVPSGSFAIQEEETGAEPILTMEDLDLEDRVTTMYVPIQLQNGDIVKGIFDYEVWYDDMSWIKDIKQFGSRDRNSYRSGSHPEGYINPPALPSGRIPNQIDYAGYLLYKNETTTALTAMGDLDISNLKSLRYMCSAWKNMNDPGVLNWDVSHVEDFYQTFSGTLAFNQDIGTHWDPVKGKNFYGLFGSSSYSDTPNPSTDLGQWDPEAPENIAYLFMAKTNVGNDITHWNIDNVTDMRYLFADVNTNPDITHWDISHVTNIAGMFKNNTSFNRDLSHWNTGNVTDFSYLFYGARAINFDLSGWDTKNVKSLTYIFGEEPGFSTANLNMSSWDTSKVNSMNGLFFNARDSASRLVNGSGINNFDTRKATSMWSIFAGCWRPSAVPDMTGWNTARVSSMLQMFQYCYTFNQDLSQWCVGLISEKPRDFDLNNTVWPAASKPVWGTCPGGEDQMMWPYEDQYGNLIPESRMHRFVTDGNNGVPIEIPLHPSDTYVDNFVTVQKPGEYEKIVPYAKEDFATPVTLIDPVPAGTVVSFYGRWVAFPWWNTYNGSPPRIADMSHIQDVLQWGSSYNSYSPNSSIAFFDETIFFPYALYGTSMDVCTAGLSNVNPEQVYGYFGYYMRGDVDARYMFAESDFNSPDIADMDFGLDPNFEGMFMNNTKFNQDLTGWCVPWTLEEPTDFSTGATALEEANKPLWGTCGGSKPTLDQITTQVAKLLTQDGRELLDCHVFVCNGNDVKLPIPPDEEASWIAVNGVECEDYSDISAEDGDYIHAIFDWDVAGSSVDYSADWFSDILQIGLCLETGTRNQLKSGFSAFQYMTANPAVLADLDTSNLTDMMHMFSFAESFNQDISGWDVSQVGNMTEMFLSALAFDQDLNGWCVELIPSEPTRFAMNSGFELDTDKHPVWGTCGGDLNPGGGGPEEPGGGGDSSP